FEIANSKLEFRPGMYAVVRVGLERKDDALLAPLAALLVEKAGSFAFAIADNKAKRVKVQSGFNDGVNVEIVSGLNENQPVILLGRTALSDGQSMTVTEVK